KWLLEVDLVIEKDKRYYFADPVFRYWVTHATRGVEVDYLPRKEDIWGLVKKLDERFQRASTELGVAIEAKILQIILAFDGRDITGNLFYGFSSANRVVLPKFKKVQPYRSEDNQVEIDLVAENGQKWAVEVKWRTRALGEKELRAFREKTKGVAEKLWVISKSGFTATAVQFAAKNNILLSDRISIEVIAEMLGVRFTK
ncbi:MAG: restriction endonuclease, partial [bacterium]